MDVLLIITLKAYSVRVQVLGSHHAQGFFGRYGDFVGLTSLGEDIITLFPELMHDLNQ